MRAFRNISVRLKIVIPLITLAVTILFMGGINYSGMNSIMDASTSISGNYARCLDMVGDFNADFQHMSRIAYNHISADDEAVYRELEAEVSDVFANIQSTQEQFEALLDAGTNEERLYERFTQAFVVFQGNLQEVLTLSVDRCGKWGPFRQYGRGE